MSIKRKEVVRNIEHLLATNCVTDVEDITEQIVQILEDSGFVKDVTEPFTGRVIKMYGES